MVCKKDEGQPCPPFQLRVVYCLISGDELRWESWWSNSFGKSEKVHYMFTTSLLIFKDPPAIKRDNGTSPENRALKGKIIEAHRWWSLMIHCHVWLPDKNTTEGQQWLIAMVNLPTGQHKFGLRIFTSDQGELTLARTSSLEHTRYQPLHPVMWPGDQVATSSGKSGSSMIFLNTWYSKLGMLENSIFLRWIWPLNGRNKNFFGVPSRVFGHRMYPWISNRFRQISSVKVI